MGVCDAMCVWIPEEVGREIGLHTAAVINGYELPNTGAWEPSSGLLSEEQ